MKKYINLYANVLNFCNKIRFNEIFRKFYAKEILKNGIENFDSEIDKGIEYYTYDDSTK